MSGTAVLKLTTLTLSIQTFLTRNVLNVVVTCHAAGSSPLPLAKLARDSSTPKESKAVLTVVTGFRIVGLVTDLSFQIACFINSQLFDICKLSDKGRDKLIV